MPLSDKELSYREYRALVTTKRDLSPAQHGRLRELRQALHPDAATESVMLDELKTVEAQLARLAGSETELPKLREAANRAAEAAERMAEHVTQAENKARQGQATDDEILELIDLRSQAEEAEQARDKAAEDVRNLEELCERAPQLQKSAARLRRHLFGEDT